MSDTSPTPPLSPPTTFGLAVEYAAKLTAEDRRIARLCGLLLAVLTTGSLVGVAFSLYLVNEAPLLLIGLSPLGRHLVLVAPNVDPVAFIAIGGLRRLAFYATCFMLGRSLGPVGRVWLEARARRFAGWVRWLERVFQRFGPVIVLLFAGPTTSVLSGISRMHPAVYLVLASVSILFRMVIMLVAAEWLQAPIERLLELIDAYRGPGTVVLVVGILLYQLVRRRRSR